MLSMKITSCSYLIDATSMFQCEIMNVMKETMSWISPKIPNEKEMVTVGHLRICVY